MSLLLVIVILIIGILIVCIPKEKKNESLSHDAKLYQEIYSLAPDQYLISHYRQVASRVLSSNTLSNNELSQSKGLLAEKEKRGI